MFFSLKQSIQIRNKNIFDVYDVTGNGLGQHQTSAKEMTGPIEHAQQCRRRRRKRRRRKKKKRHHRHHHQPGILSRWSWRRALLFLGGIGLEPRLRFAFPLPVTIQCIQSTMVKLQHQPSLQLMSVFFRQSLNSSSLGPDMGIVSELSKCQFSQHKADKRVQHFRLCCLNGPYF